MLGGDAKRPWAASALLNPSSLGSCRLSIFFEKKLADFRRDSKV
jgi:hypothetical protein